MRRIGKFRKCVLVRLVVSNLSHIPQGQERRVNLQGLVVGMSWGQRHGQVGIW